jgi:hypothetical protein
MSFIVQISPFVPLFTLKIVFRWEDLPPEPSHCPTLDLLGALARPPRPLAASCAYISLYT